jgi:cytoskeletal protein RodZ
MVKLTKGKPQDNLEFLQWFHQFFHERWSEGKEYNASERRKTVGTLSFPAPAITIATVAAASSSVAVGGPPNAVATPSTVTRRPSIPTAPTSMPPPANKLPATAAAATATATSGVAMKSKLGSINGAAVAAGVMSSVTFDKENRSINAHNGNDMPHIC